MQHTRSVGAKQRTRPVRDQREQIIAVHAARDRRRHFAQRGVLGGQLSRLDFNKLVARDRPKEDQQPSRVRDRAH